MPFIAMESCPEKSSDKIHKKSLQWSIAYEVSLSFLRSLLSFLIHSNPARFHRPIWKLPLKIHTFSTHYYYSARALPLESEYICQNSGFISYNHMILDKLFNFSQPPTSHLQNKDN